MVINAMFMSMSHQHMDKVVGDIVDRGRCEEKRCPDCQRDEEVVEVEAERMMGGGRKRPREWCGLKSPDALAR